MRRGGHRRQAAHQLSFFPAFAAVRRSLRRRIAVRRRIAATTYAATRAAFCCSAVQCLRLRQNSAQLFQLFSARSLDAMICRFLRESKHHRTSSLCAHSKCQKTVLPPSSANRIDAEPSAGTVLTIPPDECTGTRRSKALNGQKPARRRILPVLRRSTTERTGGTAWERSPRAVAIQHRSARASCRGDSGS